jgi:hypothetical protein
MKFDITSYYSPTPKNFRKLGDAILGASVMVTGGGFFADNHKIMAFSILLGTLGKFLTNFFVEDNNNNS